MTTTEATPDREHVDMVAGGVSIIVAGRDARNETTVARAVGCRMAEDGRRITVFLSAAQSGALLADVRANGCVAVVFSERFSSKEPTPRSCRSTRKTHISWPPIAAASGLASRRSDFPSRSCEHC
jgi:hypothetical protein